MTGRPEVTLLADLSPDRPWASALVGWLRRVGDPRHPIGVAGAGGAGDPPADPPADPVGPLAELIRSGAVRSDPDGAAARVLLVHVDSWRAAPPVRSTDRSPGATTVWLDAAGVELAAAGTLPGDPDALLAALLGAVDPNPAPFDPTDNSPAGAAGVLFVSSNGAGMGHLTRLLAMARRSGPAVRPEFASMSQAVPVVESEGYPWEYIPSKGDLGIGNRRWNALYQRRMHELLLRRRPAAVVFDGTYPYEGLLDAAADLPGTRLVWSRRGMWRPGAPGAQLGRSGRFDLVVEPGELAGSHDRGATADRTDALRVGPVTLLDPDEQVDREQAARVLGVDPDRPTVLVTLGAGTINDLGSELGLVVGRLVERTELQVVLTRPVIAAPSGPIADRVRAITVYPISRYLSAVDLAFAAAGYNSFHELVGAAVPTAFVPNLSTALDDQLGRARWAEHAGAGLCLPTVTAATVDAAADLLADRQARDRMADRCRALRRPNGAGPAMAAVERLLGVALGVSR